MEKQTEKLEKLGSGTYGEVYRIKRDGEFYALKTFKTFDITNVPSDIIKEVDIFARTDHPNVLKYEEMLVKGGILEIMLPIGIDLYKYLKINTNQTEVQKLSIAFGLVCGLAYIHSNSIIHRDIKPQNIIMIRNTHDGSATPKIADFGMALTTNKKVNYIDEVITSLWRPPELLAQRLAGNEDYYYGPEVDVWSMGIVLYQLFIGSIPTIADNHINILGKIIENISEVEPDVYNIYKSKVLPFPPVKNVIGYRKELQGSPTRDLIANMLNTDPTERPLSIDLIGNPIFKDMKCSTPLISYNRKAINKDALQLHERSTILQNFFDKPELYGEDINIFFLAVDMFDRILDLLLDKEFLATLDGDKLDSASSLIAYCSIIASKLLDGPHIDYPVFDEPIEMIILKRLNFKVYVPTINILCPRQKKPELVKLCIESYTIDGVQDCSMDNIREMFKARAA